MTLDEKIDQIIDDSIAPQHEDDDYTVCDSRYDVCQICGNERYTFDFMDACRHTAASVWKSKPCNCSVAEDKAQAVAKMKSLILAEQREARIDELRWWHRWPDRNYDNRLDEAIDERIEELEAQQAKEKS